MLTKQNIEELANELVACLKAENCISDTCIYYNNKRINNGVLEEGTYNPLDYFEYAAHNHILSMSFEGPLNTIINYTGGKTLNKLNRLFDKYGVYYELGNSWNLTLVVSDENTEVEYTYYQPKRKPIHLYYSRLSNAPAAIQNIMMAWYELSSLTGDIGSCVIGAGFSFEYEGESYFLSACSPYLGSLSYEAHLKTITTMLFNIGATNINYSYGNLD